MLDGIRWVLFDAVGTLIYPDPAVADARSAARSFARPGSGEASSTERRLVSLTRRQTSRGGIGGTLDSLERARAATKEAVELLRAAKAAEREAWNQRAGDDEARPEDERRRARIRTRVVNRSGERSKAP